MSVEARGPGNGDASTDPAALHEPVLLEECLGFLDVGRGGVIVDCTLGLGGHSEAILEANDRVEVVGIDRDPRALELAAERLRRFGPRFRTARSAFSEIGSLLDGLGVGRPGGILADLGVSSMQLETAGRGFSFRREGPLDMRMGGGEMTAKDVVSSYSEERLSRILRDYGEERHARRIARAIVEAREVEPLSTTRRLREVVVAAKPREPRRRDGRPRIDPSTRVFQALRIEVNEELVELEKLLAGGAARLEEDGRLVVISYHSLEDRIVKNVFRDAARGYVDPVTGRSRSESQVLEVLTRKPVRPQESEVASNPRARSARLRAARRI